MPWKYQVDQIQNDQIEAIIDFNNCARHVNEDMNDETTTTRNF